MVDLECTKAGRDLCRNVYVSDSQEDHVRRYGPDYIDRLKDAGFNVELTKFIDFVQRAEAIRMGLTTSGSIYYCTK